MEERYYLTLERIMKITEENTVKEPYQSYFRHVAEFLLRIHDIKDSRHTSARASMTKERLEEEMQMLYYDVLPQNYETSYANPEYAVRELGEELGAFLSALYTELRGDIGYVYEERYDYIVIGNELFIEIYNKFEEEETPSPESLKEIFYWYASDYCDVYAADRVVEQIDPEAYDFAVKRIMESDLTDLRYLYRFGEYVSENELKTAEYLNSLPQETIDKMADTYTEGFRVGFINTGKDLSKKSVVNIRYVLGFERVVRKAIQNFEKMGLKPTIYRAASSVITRPRLGKNGFYGGIPNKQYDYDHKDDLGLVLDKQFMERKLEVMRTVLEKNKSRHIVENNGKRRGLCYRHEMLIKSFLRGLVVEGSNNEHARKASQVGLLKVFYNGSGVISTATEQQGNPSTHFFHRNTLDGFLFNGGETRSFGCGSRYANKIGAC